MPCGITCFLAAVIVVSMVAMSVMASNDPTIQSYQSQMSPELAAIYQRIVAERRQIFFTGYLIGFVVSVLFIIFSVNVLKTRISNAGVVCSVITISFIVNHFFYSMYPKSDYMVNHLKTDKDRENWVHIYKLMQMYFHGSFALGIMAVGVFGFAFRTSCK